jgi:hypothetical protein
VPTGLETSGLLTDSYGFDVASGVAGFVGRLAALVALLFLPDVTPDVGASRLRDLPAIDTDTTTVLRQIPIEPQVYALFPFNRRSALNADASQAGGGRSEMTINRSHGES